MTKYYIKQELAKYIGVSEKSAYEFEFIINKLSNKPVNIKDVKKYFPDFKTCNCNKIGCNNFSWNSFLDKIKYEMLYENDKPDYDYYEPNQEPVQIDEKSFIFE